MSKEEVGRGERDLCTLPQRDTEAQSAWGATHGRYYEPDLDMMLTISVHVYFMG